MFLEDEYILMFIIFIDVKIKVIKFNVLNQSIYKLVKIYNNIKIKIEHNIKINDKLNLIY